MPEPNLTERVALLEQNVRDLEALPARMAGVELQIVQLREERREAFFDTRSDLRAEIRAGDQETRDFMRTLYEELKTILRTIGEGTKGRRR